MSNLQKKIFKNILIFNIFGGLYFLIEILYRGYSFPSMFILGGLCGLLIGLINEYTPNMPIITQMLLGTVIILTLEFLIGCILNIWLGLGIWDYSLMPFNILGQVCPQFGLAWFALSYPIIKLDDWFRNIIIRDEKYEK